MPKMDLRRKRAGALDLNFTVVAGAAANTNIAVAGIKRADGLLAVLEFQDTAGATVGAVANRVGEANVTSDGNIQLTTTVTTGHGLVVVWVKANR